MTAPIAQYCDFKNLCFQETKLEIKTGSSKQLNKLSAIYDAHIFFINCLIGSLFK